MSHNNSRDRTMIIEHTTYDACHSASRSGSARRTSTTKSMDDSFSSKRSGSSDQAPVSPRSGDGRPASKMTMWPQMVGTPAKVAEKRNPEKRRERSSKQEEKPVYRPASAAIAGLYAREEDTKRRHRRRHSRQSPKRDAIAGDVEYQRKQDYVASDRSFGRSAIISESSNRKHSLKGHVWDTKPCELAQPSKLSLRRKPGLASFVREAFTGKPAQDHSELAARNQVRMERIQEARVAMLDGRMERAIPPCRGASTDRRPPPRPTSGTPFLDRTSAKSSAGTSKRSSTSSKLADIFRAGTDVMDGTRRELMVNIGTSADVMEETRRDFTEKFRPPFEHISCSSRSRSRRRSSTMTTDSELSFCCAGEKDKDGKETQVEKRRSGQGKSLWVGYKLEKCRLCKENVASRLRGLCRDCEEDFMMPKTPPASQSDSSDSSWTSKYEISASDPENEPKPVLPPKDKRRLRTTQHEDIREPRPPHREDQPSPPNNEHRCPNKEFLNLAVAEKEKEPQTLQKELQADSASSPMHFSDWLSGLKPYEDAGDSAWERARGRRPNSRDTEFYGFYDSILGGTEETGRSRSRGRQLRREKRSSLRGAISHTSRR